MTLLDVVHSGFDVVNNGFNVVSDDGSGLSPPLGYSLLFNDEFNYGSPGSPAPPDPAKWGVETGGIKNSSLSYVWVDGTKLSLRTTATGTGNHQTSAIRTSDSPYLQSWRGTIGFTRMLPTPGWLEISAKPSTATGVMSEIVLFTDWRVHPFGSSPAQAQLGEIDLLEARGFQPTVYDLATHAWTQPDFSPVGQTNRVQNNVVSGVAPGFHKFVAHFGSTFARLYVDGVIGHRRNLRLSPDPFPIFGMPFAMYLGCWIGAVGDGWAGAGGVVYPIDTTLEIEYVRYYTQGGYDRGAII